jgi:hypothetical protein
MQKECFPARAKTLRALDQRVGAKTRGSEAAFARSGPANQIYSYWRA